MKKQELENLRLQFMADNNSYLKEIYEENSGYCISNIQKKFNCHRSDAEDLFLDAILSFRDKVLARKINYITSIRNYLYSACINMKLKQIYVYNKKNDKTYQVTQLFYYANNASQAYKEDLLKISQDSFNQLEKSSQQVLLYFYVNKMSMKEIAAKMGFANANSAKVIKARCYKKWLEKVKNTTRELVED